MSTDAPSPQPSQPRPADVSAYVLPPDQARATADAGGKGAGLAELLALGCTVPPFLVVPTAAFRAHLGQAPVAEALGRAMVALEALSAQAHPPATDQLTPISRRLRAAIEQAPLDPRLAKEICAALAGVGTGPYAVRSSMVGEDSTAYSYAGQFESYLFVPDTGQLLEQLRRCWGSAYSEHALAYAMRLGRAPTSGQMAVVIQAMVDAQVSGVVFTANPTSGRRDEYVVSASYGLGEGIVSGVCDADEYVWSIHRGEQDVTVPSKTARVVPTPDRSGTTQEPVPPPDQDRRVLTREQVSEICAVARAIATAAGHPVDVEWCYSGGALTLLQARPITSLPPEPSGWDVRQVFDNSNIQESYCGVTTPLTFSFASRAYRRAYLVFARLFGASSRTLEAFEPHARNLIALIDGRVYYNLRSWHHLLALLPNFERNRQDTEEVMWSLGTANVDPALERPSTVTGKLRRGFELAAAGIRLLFRFAVLDHEIRRFTKYFRGVYRSVDRASLPQASLGELHATGRRLYAELLNRWDTPNVNDFRVMVASGRLRRLLRSICPDRDVDTRLADLLSGIPEIESVRPAKLLMELAVEARGDEELVRTLLDGEPAQALDRLRERFPAFAQRVDLYLESYGDRSIGELKLETITLRDDPSFVVKALRNYVQVDHLDPDEVTRREQAHFKAAVADLRGRVGPWTRWRLTRQVRATRKAVKARESLRLMRTLAFGLARDVYRAIGVRLHETGVLGDARDIFYLSVDEIEAFQEGRAVSVELAALVAVRKAEYARHEARPTANRLESAGSPYLNRLASADSRSPGRDGDDRTLHGVGCCTGAVEAPVRILHSPEDELSVTGRILCTVRTDPGWAPLFPTASGLIIERGSVLAHSVIVAREFGLPTVVGVPNATQVLSEGEVVRLDGEAGLIERLPGPRD